MYKAGPLPQHREKQYNHSTSKNMEEKRQAKETQGVYMGESEYGCTGLALTAG